VSLFCVPQLIDAAQTYDEATPLLEDRAAGELETPPQMSDQSDIYSSALEDRASATTRSPYRLE